MTILFNQPLNVINVGIAMFSDDLKKQHVPVTQLDWTPPGQGNMQVVDALDRLAEKPLAEKIAAANKIALERIIQSHPVLVGYDQDQRGAGHDPHHHSARRSARLLGEHVRGNERRGYRRAGV